MMNIGIQFFGGRGSGGGGSARSGGGGSSERTFSSKDLATTGKTRTGESPLYNSEVQSYTDQVARDVKPGDKVEITRTYRDGSTQTSTLTVTQETKTWADGSKTVEKGAKVTSGSFAYASGGDNYFRSGSSLAAEISAGRSRVRSVTVKVTKKGKR